MTIKFKEVLKKKAGFTLVELLLVVAILGVIAALAIPRIGENVRDSRTNGCRRNMKMIREQLELYKQKSISQYPADSAGFAAFSLDRTWFERRPVCPRNSTAYSYARVTGPPEDFSLSCLSDENSFHNFASGE